jgi:hypothetical protein
VPNITLTRRSNALLLFQAYVEQAVATGASPKGLEQQFAAQLAISPSMWSQIKSSRPIGDKLARQIEHHAVKPEGWLDQANEAPGVTAAEQAFLDEALAAYRAANAKGKKELRRLINMKTAD